MAPHSVVETERGQMYITQLLLYWLKAETFILSGDRSSLHFLLIYPFYRRFSEFLHDTQDWNFAWFCLSALHISHYPHSFQ